MHDLGGCGRGGWARLLGPCFPHSLLPVAATGAQVAPGEAVPPSPPLSAEPDRMSWWNSLTGGNSKRDSKPQRVDYLSEALALERQGDFDAALTSYRLALRDHPNDPKILQNMAIAFSKTGRLEEAIRSYRRALELDPALSGSHYGLAFLLLKRGDSMGASRHLEAFLSQPPDGVDTGRWVRHARETLELIQSGADSAGELE